jgi:hypothetical protein
VIDQGVVGCLSHHLQTGEGIMATEPTYDEIKRAILNAVATFNVRAGEIVPMMNLRLKLPKHFRGKEVGDAFNEMIGEGLITYEGGKFIKLTDDGFAQM